MTYRFDIREVEGVCRNRRPNYEAVLAHVDGPPLLRARANTKDEASARLQALVLSDCAARLRAVGANANVSVPDREPVDWRARAIAAEGEIARATEALQAALETDATCLPALALVVLTVLREAQSEARASAFLLREAQSEVKAGAFLLARATDRLNDLEVPRV